MVVTIKPGGWQSVEDGSLARQTRYKNWLGRSVLAGAFLVSGRNFWTLTADASPAETYVSEITDAEEVAKEKANKLLKIWGYELL